MTYYKSILKEKKTAPTSKMIKEGMTKDKLLGYEVSDLKDLKINEEESCIENLASLVKLFTEKEENEETGITNALARGIADLVK